METGQNLRPRTCNGGCVMSVLVPVKISAALIAIALYVVFTIDPPSLSVATASVSAFSVSGSSISALWDIGFRASDNNTGATSSFEKVEAAVYYKEAKLSETSMPPFDPYSKNGTVRKSWSAEAANLDPAVITAMNSERASTGSIEFTVILKAKINYRAPPWWYNTVSRHMDATCNGISIVLPENSSQGILAGSAKACAVRRGDPKVSGLGMVFILTVILVCGCGVGIITASVCYYHHLKRKRWERQ